MTRLEFNNQVLLLSRRLYLVAFRFLRRQEDAEDAVQEVFIKLWNRLDELDRYNSLEAFAITTVKNHCIDIIRKGKAVFSEDTNNYITVINDDPSPDEIMERQETSDLLGRIISELPDNYRMIVQLKDIDGLSYEEVATATEQNINTLRVNLSRARKLIRDEFKKSKYEYRGSVRSSGKIL
jgi:RNA polymerase sigma factor (sigma-70 family)